MYHTWRCEVGNLFIPLSYDSPLESLKLEVHYYKCDEKFKSMVENLKN
jgi:hypothetical protein